MSEKYYKNLYLELVEKYKALDKEVNVWREIKRRRSARQQSKKEKLRGITIRPEDIIYDDVED